MRRKSTLDFRFWIQIGVLSLSRQFNTGNLISREDAPRHCPLHSAFC
jgi:hypothetical protein